MFEAQLGIREDYVAAVQLSTLEASSRAYMVSWMLEVQIKHRLSTETFFLAVHITSRLLSTVPITSAHMHILSFTALLVARKFVEKRDKIQLGSLVKELSEGKFTAEEVKAMEASILLNLDFELSVPTSYDFLFLFSQWARAGFVDERVYCFAQYLCELTTLDDLLLKYRPSEIAAACLILAVNELDTENGGVWDSRLEVKSGMSS